jgi:hypothetical protein
MDPEIENTKRYINAAVGEIKEKKQYLQNTPILYGIILFIIILVIYWINILNKPSMCGRWYQIINREHIEIYDITHNIYSNEVCIKSSSNISKVHLCKNKLYTKQYGVGLWIPEKQKIIWNFENQHLVWHKFDKIKPTKIISII